MSDLKWQDARSVRLSGDLISMTVEARPTDLVNEVTGAKVAFDGSFLHIHPSGDAPVTVVPAAMLKRVVYERSTPWAGVATSSG
ncbi:hypothetical protein [Streptomyces sp. SLBN-31]|uniref:hypothetical protein n=1 Tax=Streptomyces sp. SLBN-31 TaxID=2768444 RepID=UPI00114EEF98|nr:hypothetical protein [Streptomyces sp. SLBN-31]